MSSKFYDKCKEGYLGHFTMSWKILEGQPHLLDLLEHLLDQHSHYFLLAPFTSVLLYVKFYWEGGWFNHLKYFENHKS